MREEMENSLAKMCRRLLKPVARLLLRSGMTYVEFAEVAKTTFVDVAIGEFGKHGRPANLSRVAIITGLGRREVSRIRDSIAHNVGSNGEAQDDRLWSPAARVLSGWYQDREFLDKNGKPKQLPLLGEDASMHTLISRYCGDIPPGAMISELQRTGSIDVVDGIARAVTRSYTNTDQSPQVLDMVGTYIHDFATTLEFNLQVGPDEKPWFQRIADNAHLTPAKIKQFKKVVARSGQTLLEDFDQWMTDHEITDDEAQVPMRAGVGIYFFQDRRRTRSHKMTWSESLLASSSVDQQSEGEASAAAKIPIGDTP